MNLSNNAVVDVFFYPTELSNYNILRNALSNYNSPALLMEGLKT